jgi:hypothetical protein
MTAPTPLFSAEEITAIRRFVKAIDDDGVTAKLVAQVLHTNDFSVAAVDNFDDAMSDIKVSYKSAQPESIVACGASLDMVVSVARATFYIPVDCLPADETMLKIKLAFWDRVRAAADE